MNATLQKKRPTFARYIGLTVGVFAILVLAFAVYVWSEKQLDRAYEMRHQSYLLADELRQSSDDLTRMARTYVVTGDPRYKEYYQAILDIRDGTKPRPQNYQSIYWDLVQAKGEMPRPDSGQAIALLDLMHQAGFSGQEFRKLEETKANSDGLIDTEFVAMKLVETALGKTGTEAGSSRATALLMMHDDKYHQTKVAIMKPVDEFYTLMEARTLAAVQSARTKALIVRIVFVLFALSLLFTFLRTNKYLHATLGGTVDEVYAHIARIGRGEFSSAIPDAGVSENSVLGWLAKTQGKLKKIDHQRQQAEEETINALRFQQELLDAVPSPIFYKDAARVYIGGNKAFARYLGLSPEQFIGKTAYDIAPADLAGKYDQADRDLLGNAGVQSYEASVVHADGTRHDVVFNKAVYTDAAGQVAGLIGVMLDVTEYKQMVDQLRVSDLALKAVSQGVLVSSADGCLLSVNDAFLSITGYSQAEVLGHSCRFIQGPLTDPLTVAAIREAKEEASEFSGEILNYRKDGTAFWNELTISPVRNEQGRLTHFIGVTRDIMARKQAEAELLRSNSELEQFSYAISHDMRQPLRMISSFLQLLEMALADQLDGEKREYFHFAIDGAKRLDAMLLGLLEYSLVGRQGEPQAWIESRAVLDEALLFLQPAVAEAQAEVRIDGDWPKIFVSPDEMLRLLQNLIGNALKFRVAGRPPVVTVSSESSGQTWRLCVADNGVGIPLEQSGRLFQVFQRLHSRGAYEGTGIGLALCRKIAEHQGGRITVESAGEGQGSRFCVELPQEVA
ncbi:PAS domain-containing sensor histidine kinase [Propionivibrio sp.]|uniref:PAS domain-containing sensor histidine kinase n=1 Tax=Propionivibrio sp. TaxID=2212460 RepID=UPI003BF2ECFF